MKSSENAKQMRNILKKWLKKIYKYYENISAFHITCKMQSSSWAGGGKIAACNVYEMYINIHNTYIVGCIKFSCWFSTKFT